MLRDIGPAAARYIHMQHDDGALRASMPSAATILLRNDKLWVNSSAKGANGLLNRLEPQLQARLRSMETV
jgi:hypothetical protein